MFNVSISVEGNRVSGEFIVDSYFFEPSHYSYAFYLYKGNEKIDSVLYSNNMKVDFLLPDTTGGVYIRAYVKDIRHGDIRTYDSEKVTIHD